jgi:CO/xanthine dehydrogenase FAD-binding subunit
MKPAPFKYIAATSLEHALSLKAEHGDDAKFLAGGQSLMPTMNFRLAQPAILIDINGIDGVAGVRPGDAGRSRIGALTRYRTLERDPALARAFPLIADALPHIAHPQIRNRGTIGGNLSHADPASELPAIAVALHARFHVQAAGKARWVAASDFFVSALTTDLQPDEMLVEIELPPPKPRTGSCFMEIARRRGDFAIVGIAAGFLRRGRNPHRRQFRGRGPDRTSTDRTSRLRRRGIRAGDDRPGRQRPCHRRLSAPCRGRPHRAGADHGSPAGARWTLTITTSRYR